MNTVGVRPYKRFSLAKRPSHSPNYPSKSLDRPRRHRYNSHHARQTNSILCCRYESALYVDTSLPTEMSPFCFCITTEQCQHRPICMNSEQSEMSTRWQFTHRKLLSSARGNNEPPCSIDFQVEMINSSVNLFRPVPDFIARVSKVNTVTYWLAPSIVRHLTCTLTWNTGREDAGHQWGGGVLRYAVSRVYTPYAVRTQPKCAHESTHLTRVGAFTLHA